MAESGGAERVAFELMNTIIQAEKGSKEYRTKSELLDLYLECRRAVMMGKKGTSDSA